MISIIDATEKQGYGKEQKKRERGKGKDERNLSCSQS